VAAVTTRKNIGSNNNKRSKNYRHRDETETTSVLETDDESCSSSSSFSLSAVKPERIPADPSASHDPCIVDEVTKGSEKSKKKNNNKSSSPDAIHSSLKLLSSDDLDLNRLGLQRLLVLLWTSSSKNSKRWNKFRPKEHGSSSEEIVVARALVFGGAKGSVDERLQRVFATMICDCACDGDDECDSSDNGGELENDADSDDEEPLPVIPPVFTEQEDALLDWILDYDPTQQQQQQQCARNNSTGTSISNLDTEDDDDDYYYEDENERTAATTATCFSHGPERDVSSWIHHSEGKSGGALHNHALRILARALTQCFRATRTTNRQHQQQQLENVVPLENTVWKTIVRSLADNIETNHNPDATGYSLKIFSLLCAVHPETILPLLRNSLFAHLVYLTYYGKRNRFPRIHSEALGLLQKAQGSYTTISITSSC